MSEYGPPALPLHAVRIQVATWMIGLKYAVQFGDGPVYLSPAMFELVEHADALLAAHPIRRVRLTGRPAWTSHSRFAQLVGDVRSAGTPWAAVRAELHQGDGADCLAALLRCRYRGVEFELPADIGVASFGLTVQMTAFVPPSLLRGVIGMVNVGAFHGFTLGTLVLDGFDITSNAMGYAARLDFRAAREPADGGRSATDFDAFVALLCGAFDHEYRAGVGSLK